MGETASAPSNAALQSSISFGRFENDSLSWEKWSTFSPNKYLEEVEKFSTPGSVAEKKKYFETHYKKIAARKAELLEQDKLMGISYLIPNDQGHGQELIRNTAEAKYEIDASEDRNSAEETKQDTGFMMEGGGGFFEVPSEDDLITIECYSMPFERAQEDVCKSLYSSSFVTSEEVESTIKEIQRVIPPAVLKTEDGVIDMGIAPNCSHKENSKPCTPRNPPPSSCEETKVLNPPRNPQKTSKVIKDKSTPNVIKKKVASPVQRSPQTSTPPQRVSKPTASTAKPASRFSTVRGTASSLPRTRTPTSEGNHKKVVAPKSLHSLNSPSPQAPAASSFSTPRKSFIMEKMGDKDIVKRAFKMFQNSPGRLNSPSNEKPSQQVPFGGTELKAALKSNGSDRPKVQRATIQKGPKAAPPSFGLRSSETAEKRRELGHKSLERSDAKQTAVTVKHIQSKSKEEKEAGSNTSKQSSNLRTRSLPPNRGQPKLKSNRAKDDSKNKLLQ